MVALAVQYLAIAAVFQLVDGAQAVAAGVLRGLQDTRVPMMIALFGYWVVGFGTAMLLGFRHAAGGASASGSGCAVGLAGRLGAAALALARARAARPAPGPADRLIVRSAAR